MFDFTTMLQIPLAMVLIILLYCLGEAIKKSPQIPDYMIIVILLLVAIFPCVMYALAVFVYIGWQSVLLAVLNGLKYAVLCVMATVFGKNIIKQYINYTLDKFKFNKDDGRGR